MAKKLEVYKCSICGNIVEVLHGGDGELVCCGQPMENLIAKTADQGKEKHVPVIEKLDGSIKVKIGSIPHPMEEKHYIEWIEVIADGKAYRQFLNPGEKPEAVFTITAKKITAREHCNVHGLWEAK
ncbi:MAG: desulfoferrodoxin [Planctomycetes bacterium RBG_13_44_8b]|nr:MAG: desulfoferrodoxin [Planctomycetes bacterium RBG_13_44_8b]